MLYTPPTGAATANDPYIGKNVAAGIQGSKVPPKAVENPQREIVNAELAAGLTPSATDTTQLTQAMAIGLWLGTFGGTANALTATIAGSVVIPALVIGMTVHGIVGAAANTGAATLNLGGITSAPGAKPIVKKDGSSALAAGDLPAGAIVSFRWDGTSFRHVGSAASDTASQVTTTLTTAIFQAPYSMTAAGGYSYTAPSTGIYEFEAEGIGGAGGAGLGTGAGGGGGGGGYIHFRVFLAAGETVSMTMSNPPVGGGVGTSNSGGSGATLTISLPGGTNIFVGGGLGGAGANSGGAGLGGSGGTVTTSIGSRPIAIVHLVPGESGYQGDNTGSAGHGGKGGQSGAGHPGGAPSNGNGNPGSPYGGGGGGSSGGGYGGNGYLGQVSIRRIA